MTGRAQPTQAEVPGVADAKVAAGPPPPRIMQKVVLASSRALTKQPLALLVDGESASASEILAGGCLCFIDGTGSSLLSMFPHRSCYCPRVPTTAPAQAHISSNGEMSHTRRSEVQHVTLSSPSGGWYRL